MYQQLNHNNNKFMTKRPHKGRGVIEGGGGLWLNVKEIGPEGRWGEGFFDFWLVINFE